MATLKETPLENILTYQSPELNAALRRIEAMGLPTPPAPQPEDRRANLPRNLASLPMGELQALHVAFSNLLGTAEWEFGKLKVNRMSAKAEYAEAFGSELMVTDAGAGDKVTLRKAMAARQPQLVDLANKERHINAMYDTLEGLIAGYTKKLWTIRTEVERRKGRADI